MLRSQLRRRSGAAHNHASHNNTADDSANHQTNHAHHIGPRAYRIDDQSKRYVWQYHRLRRLPLWQLLFTILLVRLWHGILRHWLPI